MPSEAPPTTIHGERVIRVFISSTFVDMHAERDYLSRMVFPELRSRCQRRGAEFIGVDLRWGVTEEEAQQQGALGICLGEIERCKPFFVGLLGERYGWVPPPDEVPPEFVEGLTAKHPLPPEVEAWYRLDDSSDPPVFRLRRDQKLPPEQADDLVRFWEVSGLPLAGESITAREIRKAVLDPGQSGYRTFFYFRQPGLETVLDLSPEQLAQFVEQDPDRRSKLAELKKSLQQRSDGVVVREYPHRGMSTEWLQKLGEMVLADLWSAIEPVLDLSPETGDAHDRERAHHERFVRDRTRLFIGREELLARLVTYAGSEQETEPLVVTGAPGSGKSAALAECARLCRTIHRDALVLPHFIGASPGSTGLASTLRSLCEALRRGCELEDEVPEDPQKLAVRLPAFLEKAGAKRRVILVLDALNQLDPADRSHELGWLPFRLPAGVRIVAGTLEGDCLDRLKERVSAEHVIPVPALPDADRRALVERHLAGRRKKLGEEQLGRLLDTTRRPDASLPLYLLVALEELCLHGDFQTVGKRIDSLPPTVPELFNQVLDRLEEDHGPVMTGAICRWLAASRSGLLESEVLDLLAGDEPFPRARWVKFYRALEPYLRPSDETTGEGLLTFFHDQLRFAVYKRCFGMTSPEAEPTEQLRAAHRELAEYFRLVARHEGEGSWRSDRPRALAQLPYHDTGCEQWDDLERILGDLDYIAARCAGGDAY